MSTLFSTSYLPPVSYIEKCISSDEIIIDQHEHFNKQTYRNRCNIYGPNGKQTLVIPVVHDNLFRIPIKEVRISSEAPWNKIHWKAICSAYRNSPYFEFYEDDFRKMYEHPGEYLFEFNFKLLEILFRIFKLNKTIGLSDHYEKNPELMNDFRNTFHPKKNSIDIKPYHQVFGDRHGFLNDLSSIDYLFNAGPEVKK